LVGSGPTGERPSPDKGRSSPPATPSANGEARAERTPITQRLRSQIVLGLLLGFTVIILLVAFADVARLRENLARFRWDYLPLVIGLTLLNYALRFAKWEFYLGQIGAKVERLDSAAIFASGFTMVLTPGKVGEFLKSYLLAQVSDTPMSQSAPVVVAERLTDGMAMVLLATAGLIVYRLGREVIFIVALLLLALVIIVEYRPLALRLLRWGQRLPLISRLARELDNLYESAYALLTPRNLLWAVILGFLSWGSECVAFYLVLVGLGFPGTPSLLLQASFIFASSAILGAVSFVPGGLGVTDASLAGLTLLLTGASRSLSVAASLLIRLSTLWFGATLGLVALFLFRKRFFERPGYES